MPGSPVRPFYIGFRPAAGRSRARASTAQPGYDECNEKTDENKGADDDARNDATRCAGVGGFGLAVGCRRSSGVTR